VQSSSSVIECKAIDALAGSGEHPKRFRFLNAESFGTILAVQSFTHFPPRGRTEPPETNRPDPSVVPDAAHLSRGVSIKGSVKFLNELLLDGEVEGTIVSTGTLTIGEHALIRGEIRTKSVNVRGTVEGNIFVTERCELQANCTVRGDIEAPRLVVNENVTFLGSAKVGTGQSLPA
jgi:cytoskeletal protein CcmA (bactofilin family)